MNFAFRPERCPSCMAIIDSYKAGSAVMKSVFNERLTDMRKAFRKAFTDNRISDPAILERATRSDCRDVFAPESRSWDPRPRSGAVSPQVSAPSLEVITAALESNPAPTQQEPPAPFDPPAPLLFLFATQTIVSSTRP